MRTSTIYIKYNDILYVLIELLNDFFKPNSPNPITEIVYQEQISKTAIWPGENFYPRAIITYMTDRHGFFMKSAWTDPSIVRQLTCFYHRNKKLHKYVFSNTMPFYADIITLSYLHVIERKYGCFPSSIRKLASLIILKYSLSKDYCRSHQTCFIHTDPTTVTLGRIFKTYLSVMMWMCNYFPECNNEIRHIFPYSNLPPIISSCFFTLILPRKKDWDDKFLLAINLAIDVYANKYVPILTIFNRVFQLYTSHFYTEDMRLDICKKLGIVTKRNGAYVLVRALDKYRAYYVVAKDKIRNMRQDDSTLNETFDEIHKLFP